MTSQKLTAIAASILSGFLLTIIIQFNSGLGKFIGVMESAFVAHFAGTLLGLVILVFCRPRNLLQKCKAAPKYLYIGGALGVVITIIANTATAQLGILLYSAFIITFDLAASAFIDHFGLFGLHRFPLTLQRISGLCIALIGIGFILGVRPW
jgi:transporter family-2 protein